MNNNSKLFLKFSYLKIIDYYDIRWNNALKHTPLFFETYFDSALLEKIQLKILELVKKWVTIWCHFVDDPAYEAGHIKLYEDQVFFFPYLPCLWAYSSNALGSSIQTFVFLLLIVTITFILWPRKYTYLIYTQINLKLKFYETIPTLTICNVLCLFFICSLFCSILFLLFLTLIMTWQMNFVTH